MSWIFSPEGVVISAPACELLRRLEMTYAAAEAASATITMMAITLTFCLLSGELELVLGFACATLGLFLALFTFRCRLSGTKGEPTFMSFSGRVVIQYSSVHGTRRSNSRT